MANPSDRRHIFAGAEGVLIRYANNSRALAAAVSAADKLIFPQA